MVYRIEIRHKINILYAGWLNFSFDTSTIIIASIFNYDFKKVNSKEIKERLIEECKNE